MSEPKTTEPPKAEPIGRGTDWAWCFENPREAAAEIDRLRAGLNEVRAFLNKPEWGNYDYMEGTKVYEDKDAALFNIAYALGETEGSNT